MEGSRMSWVLLAYRLPRDPSGPRVALWRKLRRLGAVQLQDGLVGLPFDGRTRERFDWLAEEVLEAGGEGMVWIAEPGGAAQARQLGERMRAMVAAEYEALSAEAGEAAALAEPARRRALRRLRRELHAIEQRDYFPPPQREDARAAVERLRDAIEAAA